MSRLKTLDRLMTEAWHGTINDDLTDTTIQSGRLLYSTALNEPESPLPKQPTRADGSAKSIDGSNGEVKELFQPDLPVDSG